MWNLFLDDERWPPKDGRVWVIRRDFESAKEAIIERGLPAFISFDHDLGDGPTGYDFSHWLVEYMLDNNLKFNFDFYVHSQNPIGAENIRNLLTNFKNSI